MQINRLREGFVTALGDVTTGLTITAVAILAGAAVTVTIPSISSAAASWILSAAEAAKQGLNAMAILVTDAVGKVITYVGSHSAQNALAGASALVLPNILDTVMKPELKAPTSTSASGGSSSAGNNRGISRDICEVALS